jgi:hypothetical protein
MDSNSSDLLNIYNTNSNTNYLSSNTLASLIPLRSSHLYQSYQNNEEINQFLNNNGEYILFILRAYDL